MSRRVRGFLLLPVSLLLIVIGVITFGLVRDIGTGARSNLREAERARRPPRPASPTPPGSSTSSPPAPATPTCPPPRQAATAAKVSVSPTSGSPVTLTSTATLASGLPGAGHGQPAGAQDRRQHPSPTPSRPTAAAPTPTLTPPIWRRTTALPPPLLLQQGASYPLLQFDLSALPKGSRICRRPACPVPGERRQPVPRGASERPPGAWSPGSPAPRTAATPPTAPPG